MDTATATSEASDALKLRQTPLEPPGWVAAAAALRAPAQKLEPSPDSSGRWRALQQARRFNPTARRDPDWTLAGESSINLEQVSRILYSLSSAAYTVVEDVQGKGVSIGLKPRARTQDIIPGMSLARKSPRAVKTPV